MGVAYYLVRERLNSTEVGANVVAFSATLLIIVASQKNVGTQAKSVDSFLHLMGIFLKLGGSLCLAFNIVFA